MILKSENIIKKFGSRNVLDLVSLSIRENEVISIEGASGSGKTTLLNVLGLLDDISSGHIEYCNGLQYNVCNAIDRVNTIGYVFQFHHLLAEFNIIDNLIIPQLIAGKTYHEAIENAKVLMKLLDLNNVSSRYPSEISGGECQRIALLRGIVNRPKIVFADEPTGNLDNENSSIIIKLLDDLRDELNISFIIATHDKQVTKISDKSFYIMNGKLIE